MKSKNKSIEELSTAALEQELERRKKVVAPKPLKNPDYSPIYDLAVEYITNLSTAKFDDGFEHWCYEIVMQTVYGPDIWKYINSVKR